jgi:signal transduction histidine kinase
VFELAPDIPNYLMDQSQLNAAMLNLVINARDAMPNGGEIQISTALWEVKTTTTQSPPAPGTYVRVRVKDAGQGMPPRTLQRIFDPFFTTKGEQGTGLGLPQVCAFSSQAACGSNGERLLPPLGRGPTPPVWLWS